jgi:hypothetical protein
VTLGPGSSINQILDKTPAPAAPRQNGGPGRAPVLAETAPATGGARLSLADRIRALQSRSGRG